MVCLVGANKGLNPGQVGEEVLGRISGSDDELNVG